MTPTEKLLAEQEKIVAERGYYIRPVRMANLMKAASRIFDRLDDENLITACPWHHKMADDGEIPRDYLHELAATSPRWGPT